MLQRRSNKPAAFQGQLDSIPQSFTSQVDYTIHFTQDVFSVANPILEETLSTNTSNKISLLCFIDSEVLNNHRYLREKIQQFVEKSASIHLLASPVSVQGGEACKNDPEALQDIYKILLDLGVDRQNCILVIGGGAVLDLIGYAAATAHRGIRLIRMPTTVLSQNDSGVGVKNGINFLHRKNFLGTFTPPDAVICDFSFLSTLSGRDKRAGMAEAIKVSLIRDSIFFNWLEKNKDALVQFHIDEVAYSIKRSAEIHARQISTGGDPFEKGNSRPLDYGHWLAHKLETMSNYEVKHGEAVAIGLLVDARYSYETGLFSEQALIRVMRLIRDIGFPLWHSAMDNKNERNEPIILEGLEEFREHLGGELSITLLKEIGTGVEVCEIEYDKMKSSLEWVKQTHLQNLHHSKPC